MLITAAPLIDIAPLERATMPDRVVVQYDKRDVETIKLIKLDLLGLGMLAAIDEALMLIQRDCAVCLDLDRLPEEIPEVFEMLQAADTVGVFQVESRAQMQTLPKSRPTSLDDLVVEVAIIRPGPIQGNAVHPYLRRKQGLEPVTYLHPKLEPILAETLGVILYQEQVMEIAIQVGGFTPAESDGFRRAMGTWRSTREMEKLHRKFVEGCIANRHDPGGRRGAVPAGRRVRLVRVRQVARRGVRADGLRVVVPEAVLPGAPHGRADQRAADGLLPRRGADQRREAPRRRDPAGGRERSRATRRRPSGWACPGGRCPRTRWRTAAGGLPASTAGPTRCRRPRASCRRSRRGGRWAADSAVGFGIRLGLHLVKGIGEEHEELWTASSRAGRTRSLADVVTRTGLPEEVIERLIRVGALDSLGAPRRELLWQLREVTGAARGRIDGKPRGRGEGVEARRRAADGPATAGDRRPGPAAADRARAAGRFLRGDLAGRANAGGRAVPAGARRPGRGAERGRWRRGGRAGCGSAASWSRASTR